VRRGYGLGPLCEESHGRGFFMRRLLMLTRESLRLKEGPLRCEAATVPRSVGSRTI
jgi:hypothetical protein